MPVHITINGVLREGTIEPRMLLSDFIRHECGLTGTHVSCEHGVCGCCTVQWDGEPVRSCLIFAVQADGHRITTVEGLLGPGGELHPVQDAFRECHGLQCGFCTAGFIMTIEHFLRENPRPAESEIRGALSGNLCRCTGYSTIIEAVHLAAARMGESAAPGQQSSTQQSSAGRPSRNELRGAP